MKVNICSVRRNQVIKKLRNGHGLTSVELNAKNFYFHYSCTFVVDASLQFVKR